MTKYTRGPLTTHGPSPGGTPCDDGGDYAIRDIRENIIGEAICYTDSSYIPHNAEANARLWAAAPTMLEVLYQSFLWMSVHQRDGPLSNTSDGFNRLLDKVETALELATEDGLP